MRQTVLLLGGTTEARQLAERLTDQRGVRVISSLAGRVAGPRLPPGEVRVGGFGGPDGLARWLREEQVDALIDATHPFAERITANAARAAAQLHLPLLVLRRPGWAASRGDDWRGADSLRQAAALLPGLGTRAFLTTGRQGLSTFAPLGGLWFLVRCVDPPDPPLPPHHEVVLARGPFSVDAEVALLRQHRVDVLVTKDSGGTATVGKLTAARQLGLPVLVVRRPTLPAGVCEVGDVDAAAGWLRARHGR